jgi:hypothetical protein
MIIISVPQFPDQLFKALLDTLHGHQLGKLLEFNRLKSDVFAAPLPKNAFKYFLVND